MHGSYNISYTYVVYTPLVQQALSIYMYVPAESCLAYFLVP